jgi:hypothetical protein
VRKAVGLNHCCREILWRSNDTQDQPPLATASVDCDRRVFIM